MDANSACRSADLRDGHAADQDEGGEHGTLITTITVLNLADSDTPITKQGGTSATDQKGGEIEQIDDRRAVHEHLEASLLQMVPSGPVNHEG